MGIRSIVATAVVGATVSAAAVTASAQRKPMPIKADQASYQQVIPGVTRATLQGDPDTGPYSAFTKFAAGHKNPLHTHSNDIQIVVLKGAYIYTSGGVQTRVGRDTYFMVPGGTPHVSESDPKEGALFMETSTGKFDMTPVQQGVGGAGQKEQKD